MLVSTHENAQVINEFCEAQMIFLVEADKGNLDPTFLNNFNEKLYVMKILLREEMFRFDSMKRKANKSFRKELPKV